MSRPYEPKLASSAADGRGRLMSVRKLNVRTCDLDAVIRGQRSVSQTLQYVNADFRGLARVPQQLQEEKHNPRIAEPLEIQQYVQLRGGRSHRSTCAEHPNEPLHFVHTYRRRRTTRMRT